MKDFLPRHLPAGWQQLPLEALVTRMSNGISKRQTKDGHGFPVSRIETISHGVVDLSRVGYLAGLSAAEAERYRLECGDLLFSHINSDLHLGKTAVFSMDREILLHGMNLLLIRVDRDKLLPVFLHWLFNYYRVAGLFMSIAQHAVNQSSINQRKLNALPIVVPPLPEQRRIVAEIEKQFTRLDAGVAALRRVQANLKRYRAAVLKAACEGRLVPTEAALAKTGNRKAKFETGNALLARILTERRKNWQGRGQYKEPQAAASGNFPPLPMGWAAASLEQLTSAARPICYGILMPKENVDTGVLFVKVKDMKGDKIDLESLHRTTPEIAAKYARASLQTGDLLLSIRGTYGRVAEVPKELDGGNITQDTARLDVTGLIGHRYIATCLRNPDCQNYFKRVARGVAVKGVNIGDVRPTPIPLPPLVEQARIVAEVESRLSVIEELEATMSANLQRAARLRQQILKKAFAGQLPAPRRGSTP